MLADPEAIGSSLASADDVRCSKTGSVHDAAKGTTRFGSGARFDREKCYEGKERNATNYGQYGGQFYDVRCSKTGSPLLKGSRPSAAFALPSKSPRALLVRAPA